MQCQEIYFDQRINEVCCTKTLPITFSKVDNATKYCLSDPTCMYIYDETGLEKEYFICGDATLVHAKDRPSFVLPKGKLVLISILCFI